MGDETFTVYVNAQCETKELTPETRGFIEYIRSGKTSGSKKSLAARLKNVVEDAKAQRKWSVDYMTWEDEWKHREFLMEKKIAAVQKQADSEKERADQAEEKLARALEKLAVFEAEAKERI